eukprot:872541-Rhodomonas_salina.1
MESSAKTTADKHTNYNAMDSNNLHESQGHETLFLTSFKKGAGSAAAGTARGGEASARRVGDTHCKMCTRCVSMFT